MGPDDDRATWWFQWLWTLSPDLSTWVQGWGWGFPTADAIVLSLQKSGRTGNTVCLILVQSSYALGQGSWRYWIWKKMLWMRKYHQECRAGPILLHLWLTMWQAEKKHSRYFEVYLVKKQLIEVHFRQHPISSDAFNIFRCILAVSETHRTCASTYLICHHQLKEVLFAKGWYALPHRHIVWQME